MGPDTTRPAAACPVCRGLWHHPRPRGVAAGPAPGRTGPECVIRHIVLICRRDTFAPVLELAILGLLKEHPMHGYDLRKRMREDFGGHGARRPHPAAAGHARTDSALDRRVGGAPGQATVHAPRV